MTEIALVVYWRHCILNDAWLVVVMLNGGVNCLSLRRTETAFLFDIFYPIDTDSFLGSQSPIQSLQERQGL
jgi:hypothetical protein